MHIKNDERLTEYSLYQTKHDEILYIYNKAYNDFLHCPESQKDTMKAVLEIWRHKYFTH